MTSSFDDQVAVPEKGVLHRPISLDWRGFIKSLSKSAIAVGTADPTRPLGLVKDLGGHLVDGLGSATLAREPDELAGRLLRRAMVRAMGSLLTDYWEQIRFDDEMIRNALERVGETVDEGLKVIDVPLNKDLVERPRNIAILPRFQNFLEQWLRACQLLEQNASSIAARLPEYFVYALREESRDSTYGPLFDYLETPYAKEWRRLRAWQAYTEWFLRDLDQPLFDESFSLVQTFIWPRAYYVERNDDDDPTRPGLREIDDERMKTNRPQRRHVGVLRDQLDAWMAKCDPQDAFRVISGDPGAGKSSFARMYTAHRMRQGDQVLFVPLHRLTDPSESPLRQIEHYLTLIDDAPKGSLLGDHAEPKILLVLDGLDELSKQGAEGQSIAKNFMEKIRTEVSTRNSQGLRLRVVLSGRPISVQDIRNQVQDDKQQILYLLPLYLTPQERKGQHGRYEYVGTTNLLEPDQRREWWRKFGEFGSGGHEEMPDGLDSPQLVELTQQPLLTYLVALVHAELQNEGKKFESSISRNEIYQTLLRRMLDRERTGGRGQRIRDLGLPLFSRLLEEMALTGWHHAERVVSFAALRARCHETPKLREALDKFIKSEGGGLTRLFTAFYFRRHGSQQISHEHYEFTHKSFAEYLTARRMVGFADRIHRFMQPSDDFDSNHWDETRALLEWLRVFGPKAITTDLLPYIRDELRLRKNIPHRQLQDTITRLINAMLRHGMPCKQLKGDISYAEMKRQSRNAEEALLVMCDGYADLSKDTTAINWPTPTSFGAWLKELQGQRSGRDNVAALLCLRRIKIQQQIVDISDLHNADLSNSNLSHVRLDSAHLNFAYLIDANLAGARISGARMIGTRMIGTRMIGTDLRYADLTNANLTNANLTNANLADANLTNADLTDANLTNANLTNANLTNADLSDANLSDANLSDADLSDADLSDADLSDANLTDANLTNANLTDANLTNANLTNANLTNANLTDADLSGTDLTGADLTSVNLTDARATSD